MQMEDVTSQMISRIGYETSTSTLGVEFKSNAQLWHYFDVPESVFHQFKSADSVGKFFNANIRGQYSESRVG